MVRLIIFLCILSIIGCSTPQVYEHSFDPANYSQYSGEGYEEQIALQMWEYTNDARQEEGLHPLQWDPALQEIALAHSEDMAARGFYEHVNPDNQTPTDRARAAGYPLRKWVSITAYSEGIGENLGQVTPGNIKGFRTIMNTTEDMAHAQVELWMNSPLHRKNILDPDYDKMGIALVWNGTLYLATQNFW